MPTDFEKPEYWQNRFAKETSFEWLFPSSTVIEIIAPYLDALVNSGTSSSSPTPRILHLGSGTSDLHNHLRSRGFERVTNVDYAPLALERGREHERARFGDVKMRYCVADVTNLKVELADEEEAAGNAGAGYYDVVLDKCTADAVACGGDDALRAMAKNVSRWLRRGAAGREEDGFWISVSYSSSRFEDIRDLFDVEVIHKIPTAKAKPTDPDVFHYCYLLKPKRAGG
ncbi:hypothetical protein VTJ04DRAFT_1959 [Mycothermus thermophilus]|uniref:uncharacterized protein n=1 Tax=Humicola insolens TaxID=85995 RepID=UPI003742BC97